ncbi:MAG: hypothetical protein ACR2G5_05420 [Pyrinomonadaceae bacterium]
MRKQAPGHFAPSALDPWGTPILGRCPRLLHFGPLAHRAHRSWGDAPGYYVLGLWPMGHNDPGAMPQAITFWAFGAAD